MTLEISNLREQMLKSTQEPVADQSKQTEVNQDVVQKMARLEAALKSMNDDRTTHDSADVILLKKKLSLFESRMKELEEEKKLREVVNSN